ncbi:MAG TPA: LytR C-terminal domain-containing protein [Candidatus Marinimicrobia bacterium]|nr:LytR C-terminal domain-containing protein [Candidatus Neomarinimicrobiota bacterium]
MARSRNRRKRPTYRKNKRRAVDLQKWFLNLAIFSISVVIVGFIFSMGKRFNSPGEKLTMSQVNVIPPEERPIPYIVIEVLNGTDVPGLARKFTNFLRQNGYDVISTGNADGSNYEKTMLITRTADVTKLREVNGTLLLDSDQLFQKIDSTLQVDLTLIVGKDYQRLPVYSKIMGIGESF